MKKLACSLLTIIILFTISCEIGLGSSVDTDPPSLGIDPAIVDSVIADDFNIEGTYSDDGVISDINAILKRTDGTGKDIEIEGVLEEDPKKRGTGVWKIPVNSKTDKITDGSYQATVYIKDSMGRITTQSTTFTIDNTPPVLILTKPNSKPTDETISAYGQRIFLEGSIADTAKETYIKVDFYKDADCTGDPLVSIETDAIAPTDVNSNNARIAVYADPEDEEKLYEKIYQSSTKEGSKDVYIKITASDIAGNETTDFYFSKDLAKNITKTKNKAADAYGLAPIDIYNILNGTDALKTTDRAAEDSDIENIKALLRENTIHTAMISVNPENSPYFTVSGMKTLTKGGKDFESKENGYWVINGAQTLEISVFMGSDSIELVDDENFYVYVLECDEYGNPKVEDTEKNRIKLYSKSKETGSGVNKKTYYSIGGKEGHKTTSGAYVFTVPISKTIRPNPDETTQVTQNLDYKNYIIRVSGEDNEGNPVEASEASGYGFHLSAGTGAPILNVEKPTDTTIFRKKDVGILFEGSAKSSEGLPTLTLWNDSNKDAEGNVVPVKIADIPLETSNDGELNRFSKEFTVEELGFPLTSKTYSLSIKASSGDQITEKSFSVWYDVEGPEITTTSIQPVVNSANKQNINGKLKINGTIIDKFDQVGSATFKAYQKKTQNGTPEEVTTVTEELESSFEHELDTTKLTDEKEVILEIKAYDRVGNETTWTKEYYVDQSTDKPVFTNSSSSLVITAEGASESILDDGKNMFMRGSSLVLGVSDDDGVKEAEVIMQKKKDDNSFEAVDKTDSTKTFYNKIDNPSVITHTIPNTVGIYRTTIIAYDNNYISDEETPNNFEKVTFIIRVTGTGPDVSITTPEKDFISTISGDGSINLKFEVKGVGDTFQLYKNDEPLFEDGQGKATPKPSPIIYKLQYTSEDLEKIKNGEIEPEDITFKVTDTQGFTDKVYTPKFDSDWPEVRITKCPPLEPDSSTEEASYLFRGEMKDDTSGIVDVSIKYIDGETNSSINSAIASTEGWLECTSGSTTWTYEATWTGTELGSVFATEGKKTVIVKAKDGAGNIKTVSQTFTYDTMKPEVLEVSGNTTTQGEDVILTIDLKDTNLVTPQVTIKQGTSTLQVSPVVTSPVVVDADNNHYRSTATIPFSTEITTNGTYDVEVIAKDANGRSSAAPYKTVRIIRDNVAPEITFTSPSGASSAFIQKSSYKFEGTITDANEITEATATLYRVTGNGANDKEKVGETETLSPNKTEEGKWAWQVYELDPGTYKLEVYAKDIAGNEFTSTSNTVNMDNSRPTMTVTQTGLTTSAGAAVTVPLVSGNTYYAKGTYSIVCTVYDINFDYNYIPSLVTYTAKNSNAGDQACTISSSSTHAFTIAPNTFVNADGTYTYNISVKDKAGNTSDDFEIKVQLDTTGPTVEIRNPASDITEAKNALNGNSYSFRINANDGSGVGVTKLSYVFSKENDISQIPENQWITVDFTDGDKNIDMALVQGTTATTDQNGNPALCEGNWYLYAKAMDKSGNVTDLSKLAVSNWKRAFPIDKAVPDLTVNTLSETDVNPLFAEISEDGYTIRGTVSDTNELDTTAAVTIDVDGSETQIAKSAITNDEWSYKILTGTTNGTLQADEPVVVKVTAKDVAGRTTKKEYTLYYDTKDPELEVTAPDEDEAVEENKKLIKGTVSDGGYGIKSLTYKLYKGTSGTEVVKDSTNTEVTSENYPVTIKGEQWFVSINEGKIPLGDAEGSLRLEVIATEDSNATPVEGRKYKTIKTIPFYYDKANPGLEETGIGTTGKTTNEQFELTGKAWDSNELDRIEIKCGGKTWTSENPAPSGQITGITLTKATAVPGDNNWSATFVVGAANSSANNYIADGTQEFTITAYDIAGKEYQRSRTVVVDTVKPTIKTAEITTTKAEEIEGLTGDWYKTRTLTVEVTPEDKKTASNSETEKGSGVSKVEYTTEAGDNAVWTPLSSKDGKYTGSVSFASDGKNKKIRIKATDVAGNESEESEITLNIDTSAPNLTANYYKLGDSGTPTEAKGIVYIQQGTKLTLYGNYQDTDSGVKDLTFTTEEPATTTLTKTYSPTAITSTTLPNDYVAYNTASLAKDAIRSWKLEYIPTTTGIISVKGNNRADFETSEINIIDITIDEEAPAFSNEKFEEISVIENENESESETVTKSVYQKSSDSNYYYTNNSDKTYVISGVATDDVGLADITLTVENTATTGTKDTINKNKDNLAAGASLGKWKFEFTLPDWQTGATATVTLIDKAGRETPKTYNIVFDTEPPSPDHLVDAKGKDLVFRIGNADNYGVSETGSKYSGGSFGNDSTIMIRGNFTDDDASELKAVWYKIYNKGDTPLFVNGKEYSTNPNETFEALKKDVLKNGKSISPLATKRSQTIYYSVGKKLKDNGEPELVNGEPIPDPAQIFAGSTQNTDTPDDEGYFQYYKDIDTIFSESISGFNEGINYLVLVGEDNAGNTAIDKAVLTVLNDNTPNDETDTEERVFPCFSLNVDTTAPTIYQPEDISKVKYTNGGNCLFDVKVEDLPRSVGQETAGVKSVIFTFENGSTTEQVTASLKAGTTNIYEADLGTKFSELNLTEGSFNITAVATDAAGAGNTSSRSAGTVMIDTQGPTVTITAPAKEKTLNKKISISGTSFDSAGIDNTKIPEIYWTTIEPSKTNDEYNIPETITTASNANSGWVKYTAGLKTGKTAEDWEFEINTQTLKADGTKTIADTTPIYVVVSATDKSGTGNAGYSVPRKFIVDQNSDRPIIKFTNLNIASMTSANPVWITKEELYANITDDDGDVTSVKVSFDGNSWTDQYEVTNDDNTTSYVKYYSPENGLTYPLPRGVDGNKSIYFEVTDAAGETFTSSINNNEADINAPILAYMNTEFGNSSGKYDTVVYSKLDLDDPTVPLVYYTSSTTDIAPVEEADDLLNLLKTDYSDLDENKKANWTNMSGTKSTVGGSTKYLYILAVAYDANGVEKIEGTYGDGTPTVTKLYSKESTDIGKTRQIYLFKMDISEVTGKVSNNLVIKATDKAKRYVERPLELEFDKQAPTITIDYPTYEESKPDIIPEIYGTAGIPDSSVTVRGGADSDTSEVYVAVTKGGADLPSTNPAANQYTLITRTESGNKWNVIFNGKKGQSTNKEYYEDRFNTWVDNLWKANPPTTENTTITSKEICLWFYAKDTFGNTGIDHPTKLPIKVLTQGDCPTIEISNPEKPKGGQLSSVGGVITVTGSTSIAISSVQDIWLQIDPDYTGDGKTWDEDNWKTRLEEVLGSKTEEQLGYKLEEFTEEPLKSEIGWAIKASGSKASWNLPINRASEFNKTEKIEGNDTLVNRTIGIRVFAVSASQKISKPDIVYFELDPNAPVFGQRGLPLKLVQYKDNDPAKDVTASRLYEPGVYLKGNWWLTGSVYDDSGIKTLTMNDNSVLENCSEDTRDGSNSSTSYKNYIMNIPLPSGDGLTEFRLIAQEGATTNKTGEQVIQVFFDNTSPEFDSTLKAENNKIIQSDGVYQMKGTFKDINGSGFKRIAFYVTRDDTDYLADIMKKQGTALTDNNYDISSIDDIKHDSTNPKDLYWKTLSGCTTQNDTEVLLPTTYKSSNLPSYIRRGSICRINNVMYTIKDIERITTTDVDSALKLIIDTKVDSATNVEVDFALAQIIDHDVEEIGKTTFYDSTLDYGDNRKTEKFSNDDYDQMVEKYSSSSGEWSVSINSQNIKDGAVTIHFVAYDKAGNATYKSYKGNVANNAPRIAGVSFGTDVNGDGTVDISASSTELKTFYAGLYNVTHSNHKAGVTESGRAANGDKIVKLALPNNNEDITAIDEAADPVMTVKGKIKIIPEIVGGNDGLAWKYGVGDNQTDWTELENVGHSNELRDTSTTAFEIDTVRLLKITKPAEGSTETGDGPKTFTFTISDKTDGTWGNNTTEILLKFNVALRDGQKPTAGITPFYWKSNSSTAGENSLYYDNNGKVQGHIELPEDLPSATFKYKVDNTVQTGLYDVDPKLSGIIYLEGYAKDNVVVEKLLLRVSKSGGDFIEIAARERTANATDYGKFKALTELSSGIHFESATEETIEENGVDYNIVHWKVAIDTANTALIPNVADTDYVIEVQAKDRGQATLNTEENDYSYESPAASDGSTLQTGLKQNAAGTEIDYTNNKLTFDSSYKTPYYKVDVVPYITGITTPNRQKSGLKNNNIRSASGKYSVIKGSISDFIEVTGFNLNPGEYDVRIVRSSIISDTEVNASSGEKANISTAAPAGYTLFKLSNDLPKSGYLEVFTNGIRTLNNINSNDSYGSYSLTGKEKVTELNAEGVEIEKEIIVASVSDYENAYNREPDYYTTKNVQLTDDRYIRVFDMHATGDRTKNGGYPTMFMEGDDPVFGYFNPSGGPKGEYGDGAGTGASYNANLADDDKNSYPEYAMPQRIKFTESGSEVYTEYLAKNSAGDQMGTGRDESGRYYHMSVFNRGGCGLYMIYDRYNEFYAKMGWAPGVQIGTPDNLVVSGSNNGIGLETINYGGLLAGRYQYPKIIAKGRSKDATAYVYVAYYDDYFRSIVMRTFRCGSTVTGDGTKPLDSRNYDLKYNMDTPNTSTKYAQRINFTENPTNRDNDTWSTGRLSGVGKVLTTGTQTEKASHYFDMKVTSDYHIILVYYDDENSVLKLRYSTNPVTCNNPTTAIAWTESTVQFPEYVGNYVSMDLDSTNGIHISAFDATDGNLVYMYLSSYSSTNLTKVTVDQASSVGNWTQIKVNSSNIPYIAYYNSTETGSRESIKLAYANSAAGSVTAGVDVIPGTMSGTGYTLDGWEYMTVPSVNPAQGGNPNFQNVCLGFDTHGIPVIGYAASNLEFGKWLGE